MSLPLEIATAVVKGSEINSLFMALMKGPHNCEVGLQQLKARRNKTLQYSMWHKENIERSSQL